jgi:hypothetical protein
MTTMFDSITPAEIPRNAVMVAGYVDGKWPTFASLDVIFPTAEHVSITVLGAAGAQVCDCETGDLTPNQAAGWAAREISAHRRPTIYCNTSTHPAVVSALAAVGLEFVRDVDWWEAHYDGVAQVSPGSVCKQYAGTAGYDVNVTNGVWPNGPAPVPNPIPGPTVGASIIMGLPTGCTDQNVVAAYIRDKWATYHTDQMTGTVQQAGVYLWFVPVAQGGYGGNENLLLAAIIDSATTSKTNRLVPPPA